MKVLSWNCQGLGRALTDRKMREECYRNKPSVVFLMETRMVAEKLKRIKEQCGMEKEFYVEPRGRGGGLALWWTQEVVVNVCSSSANIIHVRLSSAMMSCPNFVTFVYGSPTDEGMLLVWNKIRRIVAGTDSTWLCLGDFNDVLSSDEKLGRLSVDIRKVLNFQSMLTDCQLIDLGFQGPKFKWCNRRIGENHVKERLDRAVANTEFLEEFHNSVVTHLEPVRSDHHLLIVDCDYKHSRVPRLFKFEAVWAEKEDFIEVVRRSWREEVVEEEDKVQGLV